MSEPERAPRMPQGFAAAAMSVGIKQSGRPDLALLRTTGGPAAVAAVFTRNLLPAAPVRLSIEHLCSTDPDGGGRSGWVEAIVSTSGSANAGTGPAGDADQRLVAEHVARVTESEPDRTLAVSTGIIGTRLPVDAVAAGLEELAGALHSTDEGLEAFAVAMRTTDSRTKASSTSIALPDHDGVTARSVQVSGIAKGVGMIHPGMATMLSLVLTDAAAAPADLAAILRPAAARTWNQLTVDGDTSTNDTVFLVASGASGAAPAVPGTAAFAALAEAVEAVARDLARQQAADGEGATTLITCHVTGAIDDADARAVARSVVASSLVKAAAHGRDPNWGRIAAAAGAARLPEPELLVAGGVAPEDAERRAGRPPRLDPDRLRIAIADQVVFDGAAGGPVTFDRAAAVAGMRGSEAIFELDLGLGDGSGEAWGCDLTEDYVIENSEYTT
jgi:glutamate N-acetyltransferase/amino-acid N-acetyltransferase